MKSWLSIALVLGAGGLAAACSDARPPLAGGGVGIDPVGGGGTLPEADAGSEDSPPEIVDGYPAGPYGKSHGEVFPALTFDGYADASLEWSKVALRDYFDPDGSKSVRAIVVVAAAQWCPVCQQEARWIPAEYVKSWKARGTRIMTVLIEDGSHKNAVKLVADQWRDAFSIPYAVAIDPAHSVLPVDVGVIKLPYTYVIDPRTMKIEKVYSAAITPSTIPALETVLTRNGG